MAKKPTTADTAVDQDDKKTAAADGNASGPKTPATGIEGAGSVEAGGAVAPSTETGTDPAGAGETGAAKETLPQVATAAAPATGRKRPADPKVITVRGPTRGRWRAGLFFGPEPVDVDLSALSDEQLQAIHGDPELTVVGAA